ncbi:hypothetical protein KP509_01G113700 [Ceratopteris richardii]|uniref:RING-type E3 ubiquitin transferase n=1 Tax=Ceratopteris richardii TaxID=49495 RepID=A0A8T2VK27_CERRI|nr:hypothetical protein KP509_01G113700 [Ceratopteris richardii]
MDDLPPYSRRRDTSSPPPAIYTETLKGMRIVIIGVISLVTLIFVVVIYQVYVHFYLRRRSRRRMTSLVGSRRNQGESTGGGLDRAIVNSLPAFKYSEARLNISSGSNTAVTSECIICLIEFEDDDNCRLLPKCRHSFHAECVDKWFLSHISCPMCRTPAEMIPAEGINKAFESSEALINLPHQEINGTHERSDSTACEDNNNEFVHIMRTSRSLSSASISIHEFPIDNIRRKRSISLFSGQHDERLECLQKRVQMFADTFNGRSNTRNGALGEEISERTHRTDMMKECTHQEGETPTYTDGQRDIFLGNHASPKTRQIRLPPYWHRSLSDRRLDSRQHLQNPPDVLSGRNESHQRLHSYSDTLQTSMPTISSSASSGASP